MNQVKTVLSKDYQEIKEHQELLVHQESKDLKASLVIMDLKGSEDPPSLDKRVNKVLKD